MFCFIRQSFPYLSGIVLLGEGTGWAYHDALAAGNTGNVVEFFLKRRADMGIDATIVGADDRHILLAAGRDTAAAENALVVVPN